MNINSFMLNRLAILPIYLIKACAAYVPMSINKPVAPRWLLIFIVKITIELLVFLS